MRHILLDCDPGIDDSIAIIFALKSPEIRIEAITTVSGNVAVDRATINALKILELTGRVEIPVAQGMAKPLVRPRPSDPFSHGQDGLGNTFLPDPKLRRNDAFAPDLILEAINRFPGEITLLATGPLTNIAMALMKDGSIKHRVHRLVLIGGAFGFNPYAYRYATGDNPVSEWNVYVDPEAASIVFHSGLPILAIGGDVFAHPDINLRQEHIDRLKSASSKEAAYMLDLLNYVGDIGFQSYSILIDSLAVAAVIDEAIFRTRVVHVDVETKGDLTRGQTVVDARANFRWEHLPEVEVAESADFGRFLNILVQRLER